MISEFQDLSDKIDRLAQLTQSLRAENQLLRKANSLLGAENIAFKHRLKEAQARVEALLEHFPAPAAQLDDAATEDGEAAAAAPDAHGEEAGR
ncbi:hypothetical protein LQ564_03895 [Massilia sp. G4R7]|uniref:DUF904 domain-containing protein n=1 Tax=Massilia phyllostachyos TaxID=2898585 RepID=A0ABS8Q2Y8_9BURK|nr:hypothetical protein [Massilia phyllostachyos]MCD2515452.1 hypothetical protein [Massilia phyllostachyos]